MTDRPNVYVENLLTAARRYGDAMVARDRASEGSDAIFAAMYANEAHAALLSAARAYATRMRRQS